MLLSIIIPVYNGEKYIKQCIDSVLSSNQNIEIVVVNDGSADRTEAICLAYGNRIRYYSQLNKGVANARNRGWKESTGDYVMFLDADDIFISDSFDSETVKTIEEVKADVYAFGYYESNRKLKIRRKELYERREIKGRYHIMPLGSYHSAFMIKRSLIEEYSLEYPESRLCEDSAFKYSFLYFSSFTYVFDKPIFIYRRHGDSFSSACDDVASVYNGAVKLWYSLMGDTRFQKNKSRHQAYCQYRIFTEVYDMLVLLMAKSGYEECLKAVKSLALYEYIKENVDIVDIDERRRRVITAALNGSKDVKNLARREIFKKRIKNQLNRIK